MEQLTVYRQTDDTPVVIHVCCSYDDIDKCCVHYVLEDVPQQMFSHDPRVGRYTCDWVKRYVLRGFCFNAQLKLHLSAV